MQQKGLNDKWNGRIYDESTIESHDGLEMVRVRPEVFIGRRGAEGVYKMFLEGVANVLDEYNAGRCENMWIDVDTNKNIWTVRDDAFGIPIGKFHDICTKLSTGGKFGKSSYTFSVGLNAMGMKILNALSTKFTVDTWFGGKHGHIMTEKGIEKEFYIEDDKSHPTGTTVQWSPDIEIFEELTANSARYLEYIEVNSYINAGIKVHFTWNGQLYEFCHPNGMQEYYQTKILKAKKYHTVSIPINIANKTSIPNPTNADKPINMAYNLFMTWGENVKSEYVESYVNGLKTVNHGSHVTGIHMAVTKAIKDYITKNELLPKNTKFDINGDDIRESLILLVNANHSDPHYTTQVKDSIDNANIQTFISTSTYPILQAWLADNPKAAGEVCKLAIRSAKARAAAKAAKENVIKAGGKISITSINPKKYNGCKSTNPEECELFIEEGDSAGGSAKDARNTDNQAVFRIRGKIQNILKSKDPTLADELKMLIDILGCGVGENFNINKLRFHKIIKANDADSDGDHISTLIDGFFFKLFPQIVQAGYLYEAKPPLYQLTFGKGANAKSIFIPNQHYFQKAVSAIAIGAFDLCTIKGDIVLSKELTENYIRELNGYKDFMDGYAKQICLEPELLEFIIRNYSNIVKKNFKNIERLGYDVTVVADSESYLHLNFDRDYEHYFLVLDSTFYKNIYYPVAKKLNNIYLMDVKFKGKKTGNSYGGSCYRNSCFLNELLMGKGIEIGRLKGIGESNSDELRYYMFNPSTRVINKIHLTDIEKTAKAFDIFLGNNIEAKKKMFITEHDVAYVSDD